MYLYPLSYVLGITNEVSLLCIFKLLEDYCQIICQSYLFLACSSEKPNLMLLCFLLKAVIYIMETHKIKLNMALFSFDLMFACISEKIKVGSQNHVVPWCYQASTTEKTQLLYCFSTRPGLNWAVGDFFRPKNNSLNSIQIGFKFQLGTDVSVNALTQKLNH